MNSKNIIWGTLLKVALGLILVLSFLQVKMKFGWDPLDRCCLPPDSIQIESVTLSDSIMNIEANNTKNLLAQIEPANATNQNLKWSSSDTTVAIVNPTTGRVTATGKGGECIITAAATDDSGKSANIKIKVNKEILVDNIIFPNSNGEITLNPSSEFKIDAKALPENAANKTLAWKSDNEGVATVNNGVITGKSSGDCTISASSTDGGSVHNSIKVRVQQPNKDIKVSSISFNKSTLTISIGDRKQIVAKILPTDATNKTLIWKSDKEGVATVDNGIVIGKSSGDCSITAFSTDGGSVHNSIKVRVQKIPDDNPDGKTIEEKVKYYLSYFSNSTNTTSKKTKAIEMESLFAHDALIIIKDGPVSQKEPKSRIGIWASSRMKIRYISHKVNTSGLITELTVEEDL